MRPKHKIVFLAVVCFLLCPLSVARADTFTVTNCADSGAGSLRQAITDANNHGSGDMINFDIKLADAGYSSGESYPGLVTNESTGNAWFRIIINSNLPTISVDNVYIKGSTQTEEASNTLGPSVEVRAAASGPGNGLTISADNCTVEGLVINRFSSGAGIYISGEHCHVRGCYIGTTASGEGKSGNGEGISLISGARFNLIGGAGAADKNIISGNVSHGIWIVPGSASNEVKGNYIGVDAAGTADLGNGGNGVELDSDWNIIGGTTAGERNILSGDYCGIIIQGNNNRIIGNYIGTDKDGMNGIANAYDGIFAVSGKYNLIGGAAAGEGNVISGNTWEGVWLVYTGTNSNEVKGNLIGTKKNGTESLPNTRGVTIQDGAAFNIIGGVTAAERNLISGNNAQGVLILNYSASNEVKGNYIGTDLTGMSDLGNKIDGVRLVAGSKFNKIGGEQAGAGNVISGNDANGVYLGDSNSVSNEVKGNLIGTKSNGTEKLANSGRGVWVDNGAKYNIIGGTGEARNVISGNSGDGVQVGFSAGGTDYNQVKGNYIGVDINGTAALGNTGIGVNLWQASYSVVGGATSAEGNIIGDNGSRGIDIYGQGACTNEIANNYIGTDKSGALNLGNKYEGISIAAQAKHNISGPNNIIAFNGISGGGSDNQGIQIIQYGTVSVFGNQITRNSMYQNYGKGIVLSGGANASIEAPNIRFADYNPGTGITALVGTAPASSILELFDTGEPPDPSGYGEGKIYVGTAEAPVSGNFWLIYSGSSWSTGTACATATDSALNSSEFSNSRFINGLNPTTEGIVLSDRITGSTTYTNNRIVSLEAINVSEDAYQMKISEEATLAGAVYQDYVNPTTFELTAVEGTHEVYYRLIDVVTMESAIVSASIILDTIHPSVESIVLRDRTTGNTLESDERTVTLEAVNVSADAASMRIAQDSGFTANSTGWILFVAASEYTFTPGYGARTAYFQVRDHASNESNVVSGAITLVTPPPNVVYNCNDSGPGSLSYVLTSAEAAGGNWEVLFDISTAEAGYSTGESYPGLVTNEAGSNKWFRIIINSSLPTITQNNIYIHGSTQSIEANNALGPEVEVRAAVSMGGFTVSGNYCTIEGLVINRFTGGPGISVSGEHDQVKNCYIGTTASGEAGSANNWGISISSGGRYNLIGGYSAAERNVISGNVSHGVWIEIGSSSNEVKGNYVGSDAAGTARLGNTSAGGSAGIEVDSGYNTIGGTTEAERNLVADNYVGIVVQGSSNRVIGNYVGTDKSGLNGLGNGNAGISVIFGAQNFIGGSAEGEGNLVSGNTSIGIWLAYSSASSNEVKGNYVGVKKNGTEALPNYNGIVIQDGAAFNIIGGRATAEGNLVSGNTFQGVLIQSYSPSNEVLGNIIGLNKSADTQLANGSDGLRIWESSDNIVGSSEPGGRNVISGNGGEGMVIGNQSYRNKVYGNYIGPSGSGNGSFPNALNGISIYSDVAYNLIGGSLTGEGNIISGNSNHGIYLSGTTATSNEVKGNLIGLNKSGNIERNLFSGICIASGPRFNIIGGTTEAERNVISGNSQNGVYFYSDTSYNRLTGNYIGTDPTGTAARMNSINGLYLLGGPHHNLITGNLISGNFFEGVRIEGVGSDSNELKGNYIGTDVSGEAAMKNWFNGIYIYRGPINNIIGGVGPGEGNIISGNSYNGVHLSGLIPTYPTDGNRITRNSMFANNELGIRLDDANSNEAYPQVRYADYRPDGGGIAILAGTAEANTTVELFLTEYPPDASDYGEGKTYRASVETNSLGKWRYTEPGTGLSSGTLCATATDGIGNTSEFSLNKTINTVDPTADNLYLHDRFTGSTTHTNNRIVSLEVVNFSPDAYEMKMSEDPGFAGAGWVDFQIPTTFELSAVNGTKTVYFKVRDIVSLESTPISASIILGLSSPEIQALYLRDRTTGSTAYSSSLTVSVEAVNVTGAPNGMRLSANNLFDGSGNDTGWIAFNNPTEFALTAGEGTREVYYKLRDTTSNEGPVYNANIIVDLTDPTVAVLSPTGGEKLAGAASHNINWTATDNIGLRTGPITLRYSLDSGASWLPLAASLPNSPPYIWTLPAVNSSLCRVSVEAEDLAGNRGCAMSAANFTIDSAPPSVPVLLSPADGSVTDETTVVFRWQTSTDNLTGVSSYDIRVDSSISTLGTTTEYQSILAYGLHTWEVRARDGVGNWSAYSASWSFRLGPNELIPPVVTIESRGLILANGDYIDRQPSFEVHITDNVGLDTASIRMTLDGSSVTPTIITSSPTAVNLAYHHTTDLEDESVRTHAVWVEARDLAWNLGSKEVSDLKVSHGGTRLIGPVLIYPTPFWPPRDRRCLITYTLNHDANVELRLYSPTGEVPWVRKYAAGFNGGRAGYNEVEFNGISEVTGVELASAIYLLRIVADGKAIGKGYIVISH